MNLLLLDQFSDPGGAQQKSAGTAAGDSRRGLARAGRLARRTASSSTGCARWVSRRSASSADRTDPGGNRRRDFAASGGHAATGAADRDAGAGDVDADLVYLNGPRLLPARGARRDPGVPVLFHSHSYLVPRARCAHAGGRLRCGGSSARRDRAMRICGRAVAPLRAAGAVSVIYNGVAGPPRRRRRGRRVAARGLHRPHRAGKGAARIRRRRARGSTARCRSAASRSTGRRCSAKRRGERYAAEVRAAAAGLPVEFAGWVRRCLRRAGAARSAAGAFGGARGDHAGDPGGIRGGRAGDRIPLGRHSGSGGRRSHRHARERRRGDGASAIELLTGDPGAAAMVAAARESWERRFTLERYRREMIAAMERAAGGRRRCKYTRRAVRMLRRLSAAKAGGIQCSPRAAARTNRRSFCESLCVAARRRHQRKPLVSVVPSEIV